jgi:putative SOS response-associated peptidase YedK
LRRETKQFVQKSSAAFWRHFPGGHSGERPRCDRSLFSTNSEGLKQKSGPKAKQPYFITRADGRPFAFAGLWEPKTIAEQVTFTIVTTTPNEILFASVKGFGRMSYENAVSRSQISQDVGHFR